MPSVSDKQRRFMRAVAHDKKFASKVGVSQKVGEDFYKADQAKKNKTESKKEKIQKRYKKK